MQVQPQSSTNIAATCPTAARIAVPQQATMRAACSSAASAPATMHTSPHIVDPSIPQPMVPTSTDMSMSNSHTPFLWLSLRLP
ncbi:unnamed protein product [Taenia asiatica]|uniref:Uncharacterized protein n=1 Tax=Taenia asiatica TaxID=60517 RepID=A0A0R3VXL0_TAEAS|nr:unnamed protein product [Taenia asiatica]